MNSGYFEKIIGHKKSIDHLISNMQNNNVSHAYLFSGPTGIGKFAIAKAFALNLQNIDNSSSFLDDIHIIDELPLENLNGKNKNTNLDLKIRKTNSISVDDIHNIIHILNHSSLSNFKIIIIRKIERMTRSAQNALLKTLEEPPSGNTIFILTTDLLPRLPKTLISRCRLMHLSTVPVGTIINGIQEQGYKTDNLKDLIDVLPNAPGKIIKLLENPEDLETYLFLWNNIKKLFSSTENIVERFKFVEQISKSKKQTEIFIDNLYYFFYHHFNVKSKSKENTDKLQHTIFQLQKSKDYIRRNVNSRLVLENLMLFS